MTNNIENSFASFLHTIDEDYTTEKILKSGPRGSVVLLRRKTDNVRFLFRRYAGDGSVYRALLDVDNPHLPQIYRVEEADGETAVLEQYIYGDTLAYILEGGPLTDEEASRLVCQICDALHTLHELGAVHRDIKPENVLVSGTQTGTEKPVVADEAPFFGQFSPAIIVYYSTNSTGVWLYRAHATLNGQALEAFAVSEQLPMEEFTAQYGN